MQPDEPRPNLQDPAVTARLARILNGARPLKARLEFAVRAGVMTGSPAATDRAHPLGHHVAILAGDYLSTGIEHLVVWEHLLLAGMQPRIAHVTLIRGALECAVTTRWLLDPRIDSADRIRRGVALLVEDYANRRDFEDDLGVATRKLEPPVKSGAERLAELKTERGATAVGRIDVPTMTARFGAYTLVAPGTGRATYRLISAHAHGKQWKGLAATYEVANDAAMIKGGLIVKVGPNDDMAIWLTALATRVSTTALSEFEGYNGVSRPSDS